MRQLRRAQNNVADGVNARLGGFHPFAGFDEAAIGLNPRFFQSNVVGTRLAADGDQDFFRFNLLLLAVRAEGDGDSRFRFVDLLDFGASEKVNATFAVCTGLLFGNIFVFHRNQAWQHLQDRDLSIKRAEYRCKLHADRARAHHYQRLGNLAQLEDLDISKDTVAWFKPRHHPRFRAGGQNNVLRLERLAIALRQLDCEHAALSGAGELSVTFNGLDFIFAHQELETFGVLAYDFRLPLLNRAPIQFARVHSLDAKLFCVLKMVPDFGIE